MIGDPAPLDVDSPTPITCLVCNGSGFESAEETSTGYRQVPCPWCIRGAQTPELLRKWNEWRAKQIASMRPLER